MSTRPGRNYRALQRPYTRKGYIRSIPPSKITKFVHGNPEGAYNYEVKIVATASFQVKSNALEAARMSVLSQLRNSIPEEFFLFKVVPYPHQVIRRHALAGVHKAERLQKGMRLAFGKPDGRAARIMKGQEIMVLRVRAQDLELAKEAIRIGKLKLPHMTKVVVERIAGNEKKGA